MQAHCTFLDAPDLARLAHTGTAVAHCPLSNAYFSAAPFRLREALTAGVRVGLGTDVAGGYAVDVMNAMRHAVAVSRMREGVRVLKRAEAPGDVGADAVAGTEEKRSLGIDWIEALYLATKGGADGLNLPKGSGTFVVGAPFDAQLSTFFQLSVVQMGG